MVRVRVYVQLFIILITAGLLVTYVYANGAQANPGASWSAGEPTAHVNERAHTDSTVNNSFCSIEDIPVVNYSNGRLDLEEVCLTNANGMRYGSYSSESSSYQKRFVVSFGLDSKAYMINGFPAHTGIIPIPGTNDLFVRYNGGGHNAILRYGNLPSLLNRHEVEGQMRGYNFKGSVPGARIVDHPYGARAIGISENGKWALVEVVEKGILKVNLVTGEKRYVTNHNTHYGFHSLGNMRLAISDDGLQGAIIYSSSGLNAFVIEMDGNCGRLVDASDKFGKISNPCREVSLKTASESTGARLFDYMRPPSFSAEGKVLHAWLQFSGSGNQSIKRVDFHANGYEPKSLEYLALGDSYSSGEGDTETIGSSDVKWYRYGTDVEEKSHFGIPREKCHISMRSYPYLLAKSMDLSLNSQWQTVACSGATAWDVKAQGSGDYWGQNNDNVPRLINYTNRETLKFAALDDFTPGRQKQIEFVKKYQPKVITITMGGNDIGFGDKISGCLLGGTCRFALGSGRDSLASQIHGEYVNLKGLYEELHKASGNQASIYVLGYPQFINGDSATCFTNNIAILNATERKAIQEAVKYLNNVIKAAASAADAQYIDIEDSLNGHRLCDAGYKYVTGTAGWGTSENQESFHPNAKGHQAIADRIHEITGGKSLIYYHAQDSELDEACMAESSIGSGSICVPEYFSPQQLHRQSVYRHMAPRDAQKGGVLRLVLGAHTFTPGSQVKVTAYSNPTDLGTFTVGVDGALDISLAVPLDLAAGYHTIVVEGTTYSGEPIEVEQIILFYGANPDDIDENGVPDGRQPCGPFSMMSGIDSDGDVIDDTCDLMIDDPNVTQDSPEFSTENLSHRLTVPGASTVVVEEKVAEKAEERNVSKYSTSTVNYQAADSPGLSHEKVLGAELAADVSVQDGASLPVKQERGVEIENTNYMYALLGAAICIGAAYSIMRIMIKFKAR